MYDELGVTTFPQYIGAYVARLVINIIAFILTFIVVTVIIRAVVFCLGYCIRTTGNRFLLIIWQAVHLESELHLSLCGSCL